MSLLKADLEAYCVAILHFLSPLFTVCRDLNSSNNMTDGVINVTEMRYDISLRYIKKNILSRD